MLRFMKTSLVLDGDKDFLSLTENQLKIFGYEVHPFREMEKFFEAVLLKPSIVILGDIKNFDALRAIRELRKSLPGATIIHVASQVNGLNAVESVRAGANEFIERDGASLVRLRTALELFEKRNLKKPLMKRLTAWMK